MKGSTDGVINGHVSGEQEPELEPVHDIKISLNRSNQRPASMYETREGLRKPNSWSTSICQVLIFMTNTLTYVYQFYCIFTAHLIHTVKTRFRDNVAQ